MNRTTDFLKVTTISVILGGALAGCAAMQKQETIETERLLSAAGFQVKLADTPQKQTNLQALPQQKLLLRQQSGKIYYIYPDATDCKCLYYGNEQAYQRYQRLALERNMAQEQIQAAELNEDMAMDGSGGPGGSRDTPGAPRVPLGMVNQQDFWSRTIRLAAHTLRPCRQCLQQGLAVNPYPWRESGQAETGCSGRAAPAGRWACR